MPIYEYRCESCGKELEKIQKFSDLPLKDCPECGKSSLRKLVSASSFRLKGTGWYETDFKTKKKPGVSEEKGDSTGESESQSKGKGKDSQSGSGEAKDSSSSDGQKEKSSTASNKTESSKKTNSGDNDKK